ncbi:hypothetical protein ACIQWR_33065 [Streptomyces sp. NPDC098789]|uniref:hypothetical protein n=1 Tax=Streptomyces sp. NPDC098789 TaxID=3366098 RepID=UPI003808B037
MSSQPFTTCPPPPPASVGGEPPVLGTLAYSLTVPGEPLGAQVARSAVRAVLHAYRLDPLAPAVVQVASELIAAGWQLDPGRSLYLSVRHRDGALRLTAYDGHAAHAHPGSPRTARLGGGRRCG